MEVYYTQEQNAMKATHTGYAKDVFPCLLPLIQRFK